jgi:Protein of unknown function (DUF2591)
VKHKVCELEGALLDAAVAKAEGLKIRLFSERRQLPFWQAQGDRKVPWYSIPEYSRDWLYGGHLIERERIALIPPEPMVSVEIERAARMQPGPWLSWQWGDPARRMSHGPKPLVAGMRSYVASRFGEEVELP